MRRHQDFRGKYTTFTQQALREKREMTFYGSFTQAGLNCGSPLLLSVSNIKPTLCFKQEVGSPSQFCQVLPHQFEIHHLNFLLYSSLAFCLSWRDNACGNLYLNALAYKDLTERFTIEFWIAGEFFMQIG